MFDFQGLIIVTLHELTRIIYFFTKVRLGICRHSLGSPEILFTKFSVIRDKKRSG